MMLLGTEEILEAFIENKSIMNIVLDNKPLFIQNMDDKNIYFLDLKVLNEIDDWRLGGK